MNETPTEKGPKVSNCRSCNAPIVWAKYRNKEGVMRNAPFDYESNAKGHYALVYPGGDKRKLEAKYIKTGEEWPPGTVPRTNHFATCPEREQWSGGSAKREKEPTPDTGGEDDIPF